MTASWRCGGCGTWYAPSITQCGCGAPDPQSPARDEAGTRTDPKRDEAGTRTAPAFSRNRSITVDRMAFAHGFEDLESKPPQPKAKVKRTAKSYSAEFESWWKEFPSNRDKARAFTRFEQVRESGVPLDVLIAGAKRYAQDPERDPQHTKYAEGWLSGRRWEDDLAPVPNGSKPTHPAWDLPAVGTPEWQAARDAEERKAMEA
jgi:hypothetical protein